MQRPPRPVSHARWQFAQGSQRYYQAHKALAAHPASIEQVSATSAARVHALLGDLGLLPQRSAVVLEVGSGAHGLIWRWPADFRIALDPLADFYRGRFDSLQADGPAILKARGEELPLGDGVVALVLSDNVLDHAEDPARFLRECRRVLAPDGVLYLAVDVHHPVYGWLGALYNRLFRLGVYRLVPAFPSHPFHFKRSEVTGLVEAAGFEARFLAGGHRQDAPSFSRPGSRPYDRVKRIFFKNSRYEVVAQRASRS